MKKILILLLLSSICFSFSKSDNGVTFLSSSWSEVTQKAKDNNKPLFVFIRTFTCQTSRRMDGVFLNPKVAAFFNENFVCTQLNPDNFMDNVRVTQWGATGVPTFVFLTKDKTFTYKFYGYQSPENIIKEGQKALKMMGIKNYKMGDATKYQKAAEEEDKEGAKDDDDKE